MEYDKCLYFNCGFPRWRGIDICKSCEAIDIAVAQAILDEMMNKENK